ncbi:MAG: MBL fold metallo-hydrolase [Desulfatitalea sp.]|nr:MBL fold metallo-hydrolase [Desulfatitalea sp.]NNJ99178.1 MBL fold metallo-hydrolase [Desulfatitalea sp.]
MPLSTDSALRLCVLASGSKGNAIYVSDGRTALLVDAGLSGIEIERRMAAVGLQPSALTAIVVSHEHSDHVRGVGVLSRRYQLPVYMSAATAQACGSKLGRLHAMHPFVIGKRFTIDDLVLHPFATSHDAEDPAGFTIAQNGRKIGIATDLGIATGMIKEHLKSCELLVLEANHDPVMLIDGPYPWPLKQRIQSRSGHLSNQDSGDLLADIHHDGLRHVVLAHLSETNNTPQIALQTVKKALADIDCRFQLHVAGQDCCSAVLVLR